jgi:hypothetical protein
MVVVSLALVIVSLFFYKSRAIGMEGMLVVLGVATALVAGGMIWGLVTPIHSGYVLKRLDLANDTRDALGSAFEFAERLSDTPRDVEQAMMEAEIRRATQLLERIDHQQASRFRRPRDLPALGVMTLALLGFGAMSLPVPETRASIPPPVKPETPIQIDQDLYMEAVDNLKDVEDLAKHLKDKAMLEFLAEYKQLLDALKKGVLTREEFERRYQALLKKYFQGLERQQKNLGKIKEQISEVGKELAKNRLTKKLGEALKKHDLDAARQELKRLMKLMKKGKLNRWQRKQLAKQLDKAARVLRRKDARELERKMDQQEKKLQKQIQQAKQKLQKLQRRMRTERDPQKRRDLKRMFQKKRRALQRLQRQRKQLARQKRTLRRLSRSMQQLAKQLQRQKMDAKTRAALQKLMKELSKYQNQAARGSARGQARLTLKQLKELLKRLRSGQGRQKGRLADYLNRARRGHKGRRNCSTCKGSGKKPGGKGPCPSCGGAGKTGGLRPGGLRPGGRGGRQGGLTRSGMQPGGKGGKGGRKWGTAHRPGSVKGRATGLDARHKEHHAKGKQGKGPSEAQIFKGSADKGFSTQSYRRVYVQYKKIWQEVINQEEIPPGYRYLIRRYFRLIKPR